MRTKHLLRSSALVGVMAAAFATSVQAQEETGGREIEEIVVTAQKREQSLQDVPIVVTSVSGELLRDAGVRDIRELTVLTPGLTVTSTSNETIVTARVRGVGTVGDNPGLESSVGVVIDGVYRPRNGVSFGDLGEVTRIEVLKGPQGTLFGKNTSAGVINIITAGPTEDVQAQSEVTVGDYEQFGFSGSLSGPITEGVTGRIFAAARQRNGYQDIITGPGPRGQHDDNNQNFYTVRGQLQFEPTDDITFRLIGDYTKRNEDCCVGTQLFVGQGLAGQPGRGQMIDAVRPGSLDLTSTPFDRLGYANRPTDQRVEDRGVSGELTWRLAPGMSLTSITAWRKWNAETGQDSDFTAADLVYRPNDGSNNVQFKQFSQELRLAGDAMDGRLNWLVGGFYAEEDLDTRSVLSYGTDYYAYYAGRVLGGAPALIGLVPGTVFQPGAGSDDRYAQDGKSWALFTNNSFAITDALELTVGLRYTKDKKTLVTDYSTTGSSCDQGEAAFPILVGAVGAATATRIAGGLCLNSQNNDFDELGLLTQKRTEEEVTGTAKLAYRWNDDIMTYASYSRGYKAGGFNLDREQLITLTPAGTPNFTADPDTSFGGEFVDSYELGAKTSWLDNSLLLNAAVFYQKFEDFQLNTFVGTAFVVETLPKVTSRGVDVDFIYLPPIDGLTFQGGVTYAETEIGDFTAADLINPTRFTSLRRLPGAQLSFAPRWSASLAGSYERDVFSGLKLRANLSGKFTSRYNTGSDLHPVKEQDSMVLVNGRIGIGAQDESWTVELWANNLFDKEYVQVGFNGPYQVDEAVDAISVYDAFLGAPRTVGATLRFRY
ncbi:TonB-dependent receptor [Phenylobacterium zucineum HLK1]|uniref:TonB-dependent receptor n=1 Tax=Phenylobacterium zucineum (strain HLK1) TaxID=450851 RepID=B4RE01_PHEZH|nr:TonB-dependent receptor [Phenylobacterium zucineum]ACG78434.1 TonB-dependent receptor [Phenylobacterium zucineum HLK1]